MKKNLFIVAAIIYFGLNTTFAQESLNGTGGDASGSGGSAGYSVGQAAFTYKSGTQGSSNDGVQQPYEFFVVGINEPDDIILQLSVFPNPADAAIVLKTENSFTETLFFQLFDIESRLLTGREVNNALTLIPMQQLPRGTYLLKVYNDNKTLKTFTIIKNN